MTEPRGPLHGVKVLDCQGRGSAVDAIAGLDWVIAHGVSHSVITMSFGGPISHSHINCSRMDSRCRRALPAHSAT